MTKEHGLEVFRAPPTLSAAVEHTRTAKPGEVASFGASRFLFLQVEPLLGYCGLLLLQASGLIPELIQDALGQPPRTEVTARPIRGYLRY